MEYENVKPEIKKLFEKIVEKDGLNVTAVIDENLDVMEDYCVDNTEYVFQEQGQTFVIECEDILNNQDSIVETEIKHYHFENRGENIMRKEDLLAIGDQYEKQIAKDRQEDQPYR